MTADLYGANDQAHFVRVGSTEPLFPVEAQEVDADGNLEIQRNLAYASSVCERGDRVIEGFALRLRPAP